MGDYTELRVRATIKHKYRDLVTELMDENNKCYWRELVARFPKFMWLRAWAHKVDCSMMIPFGGSSSFPNDPDWAHTWNPETGFWQFQCSLKNYEGTIENFLAHVLPELAETVHEAYEHYEYDDEPSKIGVTCFS